MKKLILPFSSILDTNFQKLKRCIPPDYVVETTVGDPLKFNILAYFNQEKQMVATATVVEGSFEFDFSEEAFSATYFNQWMTVMYPEIDPDRLIWLVVFKMFGHYVRLGEPEKNAELALKKMVYSVFINPGAYLVALKASEWPGVGAVKVEKSYLITGIGPKNYKTGDDEGEKIFRFTNEE